MKKMRNTFKKIQRFFSLVVIAIAFCILPWAILHLLFVTTNDDLFKLPEDPILFTLLWLISFITLYKLIMAKR